MITQLFCRFKRPAPELMISRLYNEQTFYGAFERDLAHCRNEAIIESPFLTTHRVRALLPALRKMVARGVRVAVNTKHPQEQEDYMRIEAMESIALLQGIDVEILFTGGHHRKLAIFDREILWEGSLSILSQNSSCEIMRRVHLTQLADEMIAFIQLERFMH